MSIYLTNLPFFFVVPSRHKIPNHEVKLEELKTVLDANIYIDRIGQPRSAPLLLGYTPLIGDFLEGPTVPRSQEVRVEPSALFEAQPATTDIPSEHPNLIPTGQVLEMAPVDPFELMGKKAKGRKKADQSGQPKKPRKAIFEVIALKQSTERAEFDSAAREEPTQPPQVVELDEPEVVAKQPPKVKRARTEVEASELPSSSSAGEVWALELRAKKRLITTQDSLLGTSNADLLARVAHGLGATVCLPEDIRAWSVMPSGKAFRHISRGLFKVSFGINNLVFFLHVSVFVVSFYQFLFAIFT